MVLNFIYICTEMLYCLVTLSHSHPALRQTGGFVPVRRTPAGHIVETQDESSTSTLVVMVSQLLHKHHPCVLYPNSKLTVLN